MEFAQVDGGQDVEIDLAVAGGKLYVGGSFTTAGGLPVNRVAVWDGVAWAALGSGMSSFLSSGAQASAMGARGNDVFFGGPFTLAGLKPAFNFARWNDQFAAFEIMVLDDELVEAPGFVRLDGTDLRCSRKCCSSAVGWR